MYVYIPMILYYLSTTNLLHKVRKQRYEKQKQLQSELHVEHRNVRITVLVV